jgi:hypothetical protein
MTDYEQREFNSHESPIRKPGDKLLHMEEPREEGLLSDDFLGFCIVLIFGGLFLGASYSLEDFRGQGLATLIGCAMVLLGITGTGWSIIERRR